MARINLGDIRGDAGQITVGTVTKIAPGGTPTVTNSGSATNATLNFGLVTGDTGATGSQGPAGTLSTASGTVAYAALKAAGFTLGQQVLFTMDTPLTPNNGTRSSVSFAFPDPVVSTGAAGDLFLTTGNSILNLLFNTVSAPNPAFATNAFIIGTDSTTEVAPGTGGPGTNSAGQLVLPQRTAATDRDTVLAEIMTNYNNISIESAGTALTNNGTITTAATVQRLCDATINTTTGVITFTQRVPSATTIDTTSAFDRDVSISASVDGTNNTVVNFLRGTIITSLGQTNSSNAFSIQNGATPIIHTGGDL